MNLVDYVIKILLILVSVYFISSLVYNSKHLSIPANVVMWSMIVFIAIDCLMYIYGNYKENVLENKIIRGCVWAVAVCSCDIKGILVLLIITLVFFIFLSQEKRRILDIPCTFMISCICMECMSILGLLFDGEYQYIGNILNNSLAIDMLLIISVILYINSDKITSVIVKIPSIEKNRIIDNNDAEQVLEKDKKAIYMSIALVGIILGFHLYSSFCINIAATHILICSVIIMLQIGVLYAIYNEVFIELNKIYKLIIAIGAVCLPYINYNNYDINKSLIYLFLFALLLCILKLLSKYKFKWAIAVAIIIVQTVLLFMQGVYIIPLINVLVGILLGKIIQKKYYSVIIFCLFFIICSQFVVENKYISYEKKYHELSTICIKLEEYTENPLVYEGDDINMIKILENEGVMIEKKENDDDSKAIQIYDANVENIKVFRKYNLYGDGKIIIVTSDINIAENYKKDGGSYTKILPETNISVKKANNILDFKITDVPNGYHDLVVAVWSDYEKQNDLEWIPLVEEDEGVFICKIDGEKHKIGDNMAMNVYATYDQEEAEVIGDYEVSVDND